MIKILAHGYLTGVALAVGSVVLLLIVALLINWLPWIGYVFFLNFAFAFVALLNWLFKK